MVTVLVLFTFAALASLTFIALSNAFFFPRLTRRAPLTETPLVSILIPARNESAVIVETLKQHLASDYLRFEVILLDDQSTDGTADLARALNDPRLTVIEGAPLPDGWLGKNWACQQLAQQARGDVLVFTDADVRWQPAALRQVVALMHDSRADLVTVWPTQHTVTWPERLVVPLMALVVLTYLPVIGAHFTRLSVFAAANGQCMAWRRKAYQSAGGHESVRDNVLEDVTLARRAMRAGGKLRMYDGAGLIGCRMYHDWPSVRDGYAKNILAGYGGSVPALILATVFHWLIFMFPWALLLLSAFPAFSQWAWYAVALIALGLGLRMFSAAFSRQRVLDSLLMPVSVLLMTLIAFRAIRWRKGNAAQWKGRTIQQVSTTR